MGPKGRTHGCGKAVPTLGLFTQTLPARRSEFVKLGPAIVFRRAPARLEHSLTLQAVQTGIERALFDQQGFAGDLSDTQKNAVSMQWAKCNRPQDEKIECAGQKLGLVSHGL